MITGSVVAYTSWSMFFFRCHIFNTPDVVFFALRMFVLIIIISIIIRICSSCCEATLKHVIMYQLSPGLSFQAEQRCHASPTKPETADLLLVKEGIEETRLVHFYLSACFLILLYALTDILSRFALSC